MYRQLLLWIKNNLILLSERLKDYLFPPLCIICDKPLSSSNQWFCTECLEKIFSNFNSRISVCPKCSQNNLYRSCHCDILWEFQTDRIYSLLDYDNTVQSIMHHVKYKNKKKLIYDTGVLLASKIDSTLFSLIDIGTAVPLHPIRYLKRGYNQAEWLLKGFTIDKKIIIIPDLLVRNRNTRTQTKLDISDRHKNIKGAFSVKEKYLSVIKGKNILLVDDVITTGATTDSCAITLKEAGCQLVRALSLARD